MKKNFLYSCLALIALLLVSFMWSCQKDPGTDAAEAVVQIDPNDPAAAERAGSSCVNPGQGTILVTTSLPYYAHPYEAKIYRRTCPNLSWSYVASYYNTDFASGQPIPFTVNHAYYYYIEIWNNNLNNNNYYSTYTATITNPTGTTNVATLSVKPTQPGWKVFPKKGDCGCGWIYGCEGGGGGIN